MAKLRVMIDDAPLRSGHAIRGMGFYTRNLINSLKENTKISLVTDYQIIHYPYFDLFVNTLRPPRNKKIVVTVPDVIPLLYPDIYQPGIKGKRNFLKQKAALKKVDAVITISETSKKDIVRLLDVPANKVFVTWLASGNVMHKTKKKLKLPERYVLYVGDVNWNKNIPNLIKAAKKAGIPLVIVGKHAAVVKSGNFDTPVKGPRDVVRKILGRQHPELAHFKELNKLLRESHVTVMGYLEADDFAAVYQQATLYCQPSFYEGFGLPVIEAFQANIPVVASRTQALVEIADYAAVYFDPSSIEDIAEKLAKTMKDTKLQIELVKKGKERLKKFSWSKTAEETVEVYKNV